jgi:hypothetical protein
MKIYFRFEKERFEELTLDASIAMADAERGVEPDPRGMRDIMAPFVWNGENGDKGKWLEEAEAYALLGRLKRKEIADAFQQFYTGLQDFMVPKGNGNSSMPPSTMEPQDQDGSPT